MKLLRLGLLLLSLVSTRPLSALNIIPYPLQAEAKPGSFRFSPSTHILYTAAGQKEAAVLHDLLKNEFHLPTTLLPQGTSTKADAIILTLDAALITKLGKEGYELTVDKDNIHIRAATTPGLFYATQTLRQLITTNPSTGPSKSSTDSSSSSGGPSKSSSALPSAGASIPCCHIFDKPRFPWRSFMLDEGRYFKGEQAVKQLLDEMAFLKMNIFHWHLTDDQGWRIEIKKYPLLTAIGGKRDSSQQGVYPSGWNSTTYDGVPHQGFYTQQQIKAIIRYASDRHITVIPEIEMPGHASAAIAAYPFLGAEGKQIPVPVKFGVKYDIFNVADPRVLTFIHDVLEEVMALFPSQVIHIGGDEVKYDQWKNSLQVKAFMQQHGLASPADLQISFTNGISHFLESHHKRMMGWNEIFGGRIHDYSDNQDAVAKQKLSRSTIIQYWTGDTSIIATAAAAGYDIVNSLSDYTYLDYDDKSTSLEKAYSFEPIPAGLPQQDTARILGLGCQMWGEWIPTVERMNERVYPRLAAYAEIGWTSRLNKDYNRFTASLPQLIARWRNESLYRKDDAAK